MEPMTTALPSLRAMVNIKHVMSRDHHRRRHQHSKDAPIAIMHTTARQ
jgi:hypothetical protein